MQVHPDRLISELAAGQHGVVGRRQLLARGLKAHVIDDRIRRGALHHLYRGVYALGHPRPTGSAPYIAAVLACGEAAVASHRSAAAVWCIRPSVSARIDVTVPARGARKRSDGIRLHRSPLQPHEVTEVDGIPVTTPARTLVDLADVLPRRALERSFDEAEYLRLDCTGLLPINGRPGYGRLRAVLAEHHAGTTRTRSSLEDLFLEVCASHGIARPEVNTVLDGHEVDFLWREASLIVEVDGHAAHGTRRAFEEDRLRDAKLTVGGRRVLRISQRRLESAPSAVAAQIRFLARS
jgi:very-short-patch-repair endonuclease